MKPPELTVLVNSSNGAQPVLDGRQAAAIVRAATQVAAEDGHPGIFIPPDDAALEVSLLYCDDVHMQELNQRYRNVDRTTDVLSFSFVEGGTAPHISTEPGMPLALGDIVISVPYAARQAKELGHSVEDETALLIVHASLQLLGYQHATEEEAIHMEALERKALSISVRPSD